MPLQRGPDTPHDAKQRRQQPDSFGYAEVQRGARSDDSVPLGALHAHRDADVRGTVLTAWQSPGAAPTPQATAASDGPYELARVVAQLGAGSVLSDKFAGASDGGLRPLVWGGVCLANAPQRTRREDER